MIKILFVCMGNICRSPAAEGLMRQKLLDKGLIDTKDFIVDSAGTGNTWEGGPPDERSQHICKEHGIDISGQISRQLTPDDGSEFDYIYCMDEMNLARTKMIIPSRYHEKIKLIAEHSIDDPYQSGSDGFKRMYSEIETAIEIIIGAIVG